MLDTDHLHRIATELAALAAAGVEGLSPEQLCDVSLTMRRIRELADHGEVHALGALDPTGHTEATTGFKAGPWFAREAKLPSAVGNTQIKTARTLRHLPETDRAWLDGRITREHVRVLTAAANPRIREHIATLEPHLIAIAEDRTFRNWQLRVSEVVARLDDEGPDPDDPTHTTATWGRSGLFAELRAKFAGADVELLEQIIEARTNHFWRLNIEERKQTTDIPLLTRPQLRAAAIMDLILHGHDADHPEHDHEDDTELDDEDDTGPEVDDQRDDETWHEADHDADRETGSDGGPDHDADGVRDDGAASGREPEHDTEAEPGHDIDEVRDAQPTGLIDDLRDDEVRREADSHDVEATAPTLINPRATKKSSKRKKKKKKSKRTRNPLRVGVTLVLKPDARPPNPDDPPSGLPGYPDIAELFDPGSGTTWKLTNLEGRDLPLDRFASVLCDTDIAALLADDADNPLNRGRDERYADATQRRVILIRDGGCTYPRCDCPAAWVEIHHVKLYSEGGTTDIIILAALCRRHHGITHRKGWTMHATADGWFWWTTPSGHTFWSQRHGVQRTGPTPPLSADIAA